MRAPPAANHCTFTRLRLLGEAGFAVHSATRPVDEESTDEIFVAVRV